MFWYLANIDIDTDTGTNTDTTAQRTLSTLLWTESAVSPQENQKRVRDIKRIWDRGVIYLVRSIDKRIIL